MSDRKHGVDLNSDGVIDYYTADVMSAQDYYVFGMGQPGRSYSAGNYRYGFGGQEMSNEIKGIGNSYTAEFWEYDPRLGRRWNIDPVDKEYESPYAAFGNNPIWNVDPNGADTAKYLSNSQLSAAVKIAYNVINNDVKAKKYNASNDKSAALNEAMLAYWKTHQSEYNFNAAAEFQYVTNQYYKGFVEVATGSSSAWARLGERVNNSNISDATNVQQAAITIQAYNGRTTQIINMGANAALGIAAGGVGINAGPGPRGPQISSLRQQQIVNLGGVKVSFGGRNVNIYRGENGELQLFQLKAGEYKYTDQTVRGLSVHVDAPKLTNARGSAYRITDMPKELKIVQQGKDPGHFEIVPRSKITSEEFQQKLNQIKYQKSN